MTKSPRQLAISGKHEDEVWAIKASAADFDAALIKLDEGYLAAVEDPLARAVEAGIMFLHLVKNLLRVDIRKQPRDFYLFLLLQHRVAGVPCFFPQVEAVARVLFDQRLVGLLRAFVDAFDLVFGRPPVSPPPASSASLFLIPLAAMIELFIGSTFPKIPALSRVRVAS